MKFKELREAARQHFKKEMALWRSPAFLWSALFSFLILYVSSLINTAAGMAATERAGSAVPDLILSNTPRFDTSFIHDNVASYARNLALLLLFFMPRYLPFAMKTAAFLTLVRAVFINLTNLGVYPDAFPINSYATFGGDLFFSGHVAFSFLNGLIFWNHRPLRYLFFFLSALLGAGALLGHYHYSIDVFAAPFIAYGIFVLSTKLFRRDFDMSRGKIVA